MVKKINVCAAVVLASSFRFCNADQDGDAYRTMRRERVCTMKNVAGKLPQRMCDLAYRLEQSLLNPVVYENAVIFYGPPGTGKTMLAQELAQQTGAFFIRKSASEIITKWQGCGAEGINELFKEVQDHLDKNERVVLFIDEIDCISRERTAQANEDHVAALMQLNVKVTDYEKDPRLLVIVATNKEKFLDSALLSRFERVKVPLPNLSMCIDLFTHFLKNFSHHLDEYIPQFAQEAVRSGMSCRDIRKVVFEAYWQSRAVGIEYVLKEAMEDEIENMTQKKREERDEQLKVETEEKRHRELFELQYQHAKDLEEEKVRDMLEKSESYAEKYTPIAEGIGDVVHTIKDLKDIFS